MKIISRGEEMSSSVVQMPGMSWYIATNSGWFVVKGRLFSAHWWRGYRRKNVASWIVVSPDTKVQKPSLGRRFAPVLLCTCLNINVIIVKYYWKARITVKNQVMQPGWAGIT
jgi:hypothetical protein